MPNPRAQRMDAAATAAYLDARDEWAIFTSVGPDGYPHSVPLGYWRIDDAVYVGTPAGTRKVRNIERNAKVSLLVAKAKAGGEWSGVLIQGEASIIRDDTERLAIERESRRQRGVPEADLPAAPRRGEVILQVTPRRTITWKFT